MAHHISSTVLIFYKYITNISRAQRWKSLLISEFRVRRKLDILLVSDTVIGKRVGGNPISFNLMDFLVI